MPGYWRTSGSADQPRKAAREGTESSRPESDRPEGDRPESRRSRRTRFDVDAHLSDFGDEFDGRDPDELSMEEQAAYLRDPELSEEAQAEAARQWKERIDREFELGALDRLPDFGPEIESLPSPVIAHETIYRPWMDPEDEDGADAARGWADLGYAVHVRGYRPLYAESVAGLLREQLTWAKVESRTEAPDGVRYTVRTGLIGPNGRHAVLVTVWLLRADGLPPELLRARPEPLPALPSA